MILTAEQARTVVWEDDPDFEPVEPSSITNISRWSVRYTQVFNHVPTDRHYRFDWSRGATENQDERPYEDENMVKPVEVVQKMIQRSVWVNKKK